MPIMNEDVELVWGVRRRDGGVWGSLEGRERVRERSKLARPAKRRSGVSVHITFPQNTGTGLDMFCARQMSCSSPSTPRSRQIACAFGSSGFVSKQCWSQIVSA